MIFKYHFKKEVVQFTLLIVEWSQWLHVTLWERTLPVANTPWLDHLPSKPEHFEHKKGVLTNWMSGQCVNWHCPGPTEDLVTIPIGSSKQFPNPTQKVSPYKKFGQSVQRSKGKLDFNDDCFLYLLFLKFVFNWRKIALQCCCQWWILKDPKESGHLCCVVLC